MDGDGELPALLLPDNAVVPPPPTPPPPAQPRAAQSTRPRPVVAIVAKREYTIDTSSEVSFVYDMMKALESSKQFMNDQGTKHVRMDLDMGTCDPVSEKATLVIFSVDAEMVVKDHTWEMVKCTEVAPFLKADNCKDGGSENKLFYKTVLSLKQFVLDEPPVEERLMVLKYAYKLFIEKCANGSCGPGFCNIPTFSGIPFFPMKPYAHA